MAATYLRLETVTGRSPVDCFVDAERIATMLGVVVRMKVNNVETMTFPGDSAVTVFNSWKRAIDSGRTFAAHNH